MPHRSVLSIISLQGLRHGLPRTPNQFCLSLSATFSPLYFPSSLALRFWRPWWGPAKAFPELGLEALGLLLSNLRTLSQEVTWSSVTEDSPPPPALGFLLSHLKQVPKL